MANKKGNKVKKIFLILLLITGTLYATGLSVVDVRGWDSRTKSFTSDLAEVDPIYVSPADEVSVGGHASVTFGEYVYTVIVQNRDSWSDEYRPYLFRTSANSVTVWNEDISGFSETLTTGTSIGHQATDSAVDNNSIKIAADTEGNIYIAFMQEDGPTGNYDHLYLSRFNATSQLMEIWNGDSDAWSTTLSDANDLADGIDAWRDTTSYTTQVETGYNISMAINENDDVFIGYIANDGATRVAYITMYDTSAVTMKVWDADTGTFTDTFADGSAATGNGSTVDGVGHTASGAVSEHCERISLVAAGADVYISTVQYEIDIDADACLTLSRFNAATIKIEKWDVSASDFSSTIGDGDDDTDFIDMSDNAGTVDNNNVGTYLPPRMVYDPLSEDVYICYTLYQDTDGLPAVGPTGDTYHLFLTRYDSSANEVGYWDATSNTFSTTKADGDDNEDAIDAGDTDRNVDDYDYYNHNIAVDSSGNLYISYLQENDNYENHLYFSLYDGSDVMFWDSSASGFTTVKADGSDDADGIDDNTLTDRYGRRHAMLIDGDDHVYFAYTQFGGNWYFLKLSHYEPTTSTTGTLSFWSEQTNSLTQTASKAGNINRPLDRPDVEDPQLVITDKGAIYLPHIEDSNMDQYDGDDHLFISKIKDANTNTSTLGRNSSGTCLTGGIGNESIWFIMGLFSIVFVLGRSRVKV